MILPEPVILYRFAMDFLVFCMMCGKGAQETVFRAPCKALFSFAHPCPRSAA